MGSQNHLLENPESDLGNILISLNKWKSCWQKIDESYSGHDCSFRQFEIDVRVENLRNLHVQDPKSVLADDVLPDGTVVKGGSMVSYSAYGMGRMTSLWGPDAKQFKPERWLVDGVVQMQSLFKFTTFQVLLKSTSRKTHHGLVWTEKPPFVTTHLLVLQSSHNLIAYSCQSVEITIIALMLWCS